MKQSNKICEMVLTKSIVQRQSRNLIKNEQDMDLIFICVYGKGFWFIWQKIIEN